MYTLPKDTSISKEAIKKIIKDKNEEIFRLKNLYNYYMGNHPILARNKSGALKNNKLVINHARYITKVNTGYLLGNPVEYNTSIDIEDILMEYKEQRIYRLDKELARDISIYGKAYEYVYVVDNNVRSTRLDVTTCQLVRDDTMEHKKLFAVIFGDVDAVRDVYKNVIVIDSEYIYHYDEKLDLKQKEPHYFDDVPIIEYKNNPEEMGDFEPVLSLIDAYNILQSDRVNDKEQLVEAILLLKGIKLTAKQMEELRTNRVMSVGETASAEYLVKQMNEADIDILRKNIEHDIYKISMTPNLADENFVGNASGVAIRYKLTGFEQNISDKEIYFEDGLFERLVIYGNYLTKLKGKEFNIDLLHNGVRIVFRRNLPQNDLETSQIINNLDGFVDRETLVSLLSFVDDASKILEKVKKDKEEESRPSIEMNEFNEEEEGKIAEDAIEKGKARLQEKQDNLLKKIKNLIK